MENSDEESGEYPTPSELKMVKVEAFDGKEIYAGLGSNFADWAKRFVRSIELAQRISNKVWKESVKIDWLSHCLKGTALDLFNSRVDAWCAEETSLEYVLKKMETRFTVVLQPAQVLTKFTQAKQHCMSWSEHLMYLITLNKTAGGGYDKLILQNVVKYASSSLRTSLRARYDHTRSNYLTHAEELVEYATLIDQVDRRNNHEGGRRSHTVNLVNPASRVYKPSKQGMLELW
jgi:hypothetical protein